MQAFHIEYLSNRIQDITSSTIPLPACLNGTFLQDFIVESWQVQITFKTAFFRDGFCVSSGFYTEHPVTFFLSAVSAPLIYSPFTLSPPCPLSL